MFQSEAKVGNFRTIKNLEPVEPRFTASALTTALMLFSAFGGRLDCAIRGDDTIEIIPKTCSYFNLTTAVVLR